MNHAHKTVLIASFLALLALILFPPFQQTYKGTKLSYSGELGHHLRWPAPKPTGEKSWMITAPPSECLVTVESGVVLRQSCMLAAVTAVLLFAFRQWPKCPTGPRALILTNVALAMCLPVPPPDGVPVMFYVVLAPVSPFLDNGHLGPWFVPLMAAVSLAAYSVAAFLLLAGMLWCARRQPKIL